MLSAGQIRLLVHLKRFAVADQKTCLLVLDSEKTQNKDKLLYSLRPLVKNGYISRRSDNLYGLLHKGAELVSRIKPILTAGGDAGGRHRVAEVSHMAAQLAWHGIPAAAEIPKDGPFCFIPSAIWRNLRSGIISTTRFLGVLFYNDLRLAVYHIGNGEYEWQLRAECSLHFWRHDSSDTRLTGILLVCNNGCGIDIGKKIIRRTLRERETLLKPVYSQDNKPVKYAKTTPVRLRAEYRHAYLAEPSEIMNILRRAEKDETMLEQLRGRLDGTMTGRGEGKFIFHDNELHYLCASGDLLYLTYFYNDLKRQMAEFADPARTWHHTREYEHHLHLPEWYAEWATFLKLPVTVHKLSEEDIHCLTT